MKEQIKARYRNKLKKIIIEVWNGEKWIYVKTLLDPLIEFKEECLAKVSLKQDEKSQINNQKFEQFSLTEQQKQDTNIETKEKSELEKAKEAQDKLMKEILG